MNSKNNNKTRNDSPSTSSLPQSPYNLRRNQLQRCAVSKRSNSAKSKIDTSIAVATASTENLNASSTNSQIVSDPVELTSNDSQHLSANNNTNEMERSEDEEEVTILEQQANRQTNKLTSAWPYFDYLSNNFYMSLICLKSFGSSTQNGWCNDTSQVQQREARSNVIKPERKLELDKAALECIIMDGRQFGDFRRAGMSKFLNVICPGYHGPSRKTVRRQLGLSYHKYRKELCATLASVRAIAITVDIRTKKQTSFICLTGHAFNKKYESIPIVLGFRRLSGAHRANNLKNYIIYEMQQLDIEEKVCAIVSDNGSDIKKAINDIKPGERFSCFAHDINLVVKNGLKIWEPIEKKKQITQTTTATNASIYNYDSDDESMSEPDRADIPEELEEDTIDEKAENDESGDDGEEDEDSTGSDDGVSEYEDIIDIESEDDDEDDYQFTNQKEQPLIQPYQIQLLIYRLIHRVRACVINVRSTRAICDYVKTQGKSNEPPIKAGLATDFEIRWNTTFIMID
ncbi:unnamed protein product [Rotaria socialis]|uniref:Uncharacterized protein n=1 Tax=Rotaria socialis TaxID=392032 RepID=A0A817YEV4_9BILA|nr:unnamed protein product [Rotaria socialis]